MDEYKKIGILAHRDEKGNITREEDVYIKVTPGMRFVAEENAINDVAALFAEKFKAYKDALCAKGVRN